MQPLPPEIRHLLQMKHGDLADAYLQEYEQLEAGRLDGKLTDEEDQRFRELRKLLAADFFERALHEAEARKLKDLSRPDTFGTRLGGQYGQG